MPFLKAKSIPFSMLTNWWPDFKNFVVDGMPQYIHNNETGWDNSTVFDQGLPVNGAGLSAYLVLQYESLTNIAECIGQKKASIRWKVMAEQQLKNLLTHFVKNYHFVSPLRGSVVVDESFSLINYPPRILCMRLPKRIRKAMIANLKPGGLFLIPFGLPFESPSSLI